MIEIRIGTNEYDGYYIKKFATSYERGSKLKMFIQVGDNKFILGDDVDKIDLGTKKYKLFLNTIDTVLVARY